MMSEKDPSINSEESKNNTQSPLMRFSLTAPSGEDKKEEQKPKRPIRQPGSCWKRAKP